MRNANERGRLGQMALLLAGAAFLVGAASGADTKPADAAAKAKAKKLRIVKVRFDALTDMYIKYLKTSDPITRSMAVISLSRMPTPKAAEAILDRVQKERDPVGRLVVWQAVLGRARTLTSEQWKAWQTVTFEMVRRDLFHGDLRIGLMDVLAAAPVTALKRGIFQKLFARTNSLDSADVPTLIAMGRALKAWGDAPTVESLIRALKSPHTAVRAELVLQAAGIGPPWNRTPKAHDVYRDWWKGNKETFVAAARKEADWKSLQPQYLPAPLTPDDMDLDDMKWYGELELPRFHLDQFDFAIAIDASRSMRPEIERLKRDMGIIFTAMNVVSREPRIGLTAFAPGGIVKQLPLTGNYRLLSAALQKVDIMGPAGEEEWAGALQKTMTGSRWTQAGKYSKRAIVLISDEPITSPQYDRCMVLAKAGAKKGFRIYGVMIQRLAGMPNNPLSDPFDRTPATLDDNPAMQRRLGAGKAGRAARGGGRGKRKPKKAGRSWAYYDDISTATGGKAIEIRVPQGVLGMGLPLSMGAAMKGGKAQRDTTPKDPMAIAPIYPGGGPTHRVLTLVLIDSINPKYADRIEPFVHILVAYCQKSAKYVPERRQWLTPAEMEPNHKP